MHFRCIADRLHTDKVALLRRVIVELLHGRFFASKSGFRRVINMILLTPFTPFNPDSHGGGGAQNPLNIICPSDLSVRLRHENLSLISKALSWDIVNTNYNEGTESAFSLVSHSFQGSFRRSEVKSPRRILKIRTIHKEENNQHCYTLGNVER